jgi:hypothetical protein
MLWWRYEGPLRSAMSLHLVNDVATPFANTSWGVQIIMGVVSDREDKGSLPGPPSGPPPANAAEFLQRLADDKKGGGGSRGGAANGSDVPSPADGRVLCGLGCGPRVTRPPCHTAAHGLH